MQHPCQTFREDRKGSKEQETKSVIAEIQVRRGRARFVVTKETDSSRDLKKKRLKAPKQASVEIGHLSPKLLDYQLNSKGKVYRI